MNNRDRSRTRRGADRTGGVQLGVAVSAVLALSACSSVPDAANPVQWYKSAEQAVFGSGRPAVDAQTASVGADGPAYTPPEIPGRTQPFPNLGDGPERPVPRTPAETGRLTEGLVADRARSRHSERGIPLQGMSGERRTGLATMADGELPLGSEAPAIAAAPSSPEVIRTEIGRGGPAPRAESAAQGPRETRGPSDPGGSREQSTASARAPGAPAAASAPRQAGAPSSRMTFSNAPPPSGPSTSAPPPRPSFSDVAPPSLGLSSAPPLRQQPNAVEPPVTAAADLQPPPPPGSAVPGMNEVPASAPRSGEPTAPQGQLAVPEASVEEDAGRDAPGGSMVGNTATLGQGTDQELGSARSERVATIQFSRKAAELGEPEREILRQVAALHQQRGGTIRVVGHSSGAGEGESVQGGTTTEQVSLERANSVAQELIRLGVSRQDIRAMALTGSAATGEAGTQVAEIYFVY